ncbi:MAG: HAMP domain-containing protein [Deltaproteobacteria bacterium]|nr:HAMP domain-containing protein [Deltaproteobacteria bacterium]
MIDNPEKIFRKNFISGITLFLIVTYLCRIFPAIRNILIFSSGGIFLFSLPPYFFPLVRRKWKYIYSLLSLSLIFISILVKKPLIEDRILYFSIMISISIWYYYISEHIYLLERKNFSSTGTWNEILNGVFKHSLGIALTGILLGVIIYRELSKIQIDILRELIIISVFVQLISVIFYFLLLDRFFKPVKKFFIGNEDSTVAVVTFRRLQITPYIVVVINTLFFFLGISFEILGALLIFSIPVHILVNMSIFLFIFFCMSQLYMVIVLRKLITPVLERISVEENLRHYVLRSPLSLRFKLGVWFGILIFIGISFSAFFSYLQYGNLVSSFLGKRSVIRLDSFERKLNERLKSSGGSDIYQNINKLIIEFSNQDDGFYYNLPASGRIFFHSKPSMPSIDHSIRFELRNNREGYISLRDKGYFGAYRQIFYKNRFRGSVLILYSDTRALRVGNVSTFSRGIFFFILLLIISMIGVGYFVNDVTTPLKRMERHLSAITSGKLNEIIRPEGEADELGRLSLTLEIMRQNIHEKIATIEDLNVNLEKMVDVRTGELEKANINLRQALEELEKVQDQLVITGRLAAVGKLLAGISHEINNPVNAISNTIKPLSEIISSIASNGISDEDIEDLNSLVRILGSSSGKIRDVIDRITNTMVPRENPPYPVNIKDIIENTFRILEHAMKDVTVSVSIEPGLNVLAHKTPLIQVMENLISNSLRAMDKNDRKLLTISGLKIDSEVLLTVSDNGKGMDRPTVDKIFDPFFTTNEVGKGMGLGLSMVHDIINRYSGRIEVESEPGHGTRMKVYLPVYLDS